MGWDYKPRKPAFMLRGCGKRQWPTRERAEFIASRTTQTNAERGDARICRAYSCPVCGFWHITSQPERQARKETA